MSAETPSRLTRDDVLTVPEAAEILRCSKRHIYSLTARGEMPGAVRIGRRVLISHAALRTWLEGA